MAQTEGGKQGKCPDVGLPIVAIGRRFTNTLPCNGTAVSLQAVLSPNNEQFRPNENGSHYTIYNYFFIPI